MTRQDPTVVVVGGSVAGLAAALAAVPHARRVVVLERHRAPEPGTVSSVVPQGTFPHVLLAGGAGALERLSPGFAGELRRRGAVGSTGARACHWWAEGTVLRHLPDLGVDAPMCTRALVETTLRDRVAREPGIEVCWETGVRGLRVVSGRVVAVELEAGAELAADVVVDATGRAARGSIWLAALGLPEPPADLVGVGLTYTSVEVERRPDDLGGGELAIVQNSPSCPRIGVALPTERGTWQIVLGGYFGDAAPRRPEAMRAWAADLPDPVIADLVGRPWAAEPGRHRFPASQRRRWTDVRLPEGFCALGDAVSSFNPIYGQGMSSAALQAEALGATLRSTPVGRGFSRRFARAAARVVASPWKIAAGSDFVYPDTTGARPAGTDLLNAYVARVTRAAASDPVVNDALARVRTMLAEPPALMAPRVLHRVLLRRPAPAQVRAPLPQDTSGAR